MRAIFFSIFSFCIFQISSAQKASLFPTIEKLLNACEGEKVKDLTGEWKLLKQKFTKTLITDNREDLETKTNWVTEHKNIDWNAGFEYDLRKGTGLGAVSVVELSFNKPLDYWYYPTDEDDKGDKEKTTSVTLFFLTKDYDKMEKLMKEFTGGK